MTTGAFRGTRVESAGAGIYYEVTGNGRPVMLLHGFPDTGRLWRHQVPALVQAGFPSDRPGHPRVRPLG